MSWDRIALVFVSGLLGAVAPTSAGELVDRVTTLELDQTLDARGNLGGMTVDRLGFLYVANFRDAVWRISPDGAVETLSRRQYGSSGNAVDSRGDLYQANFFANTIDRISRDGTVERFAAEGLSGPVGIAIDATDTLFVCNCSGNSISTVSPEGRVATLVESDLFACPNGITFGPDGELVVTNFNNHDLIRVTTDGEASVFTAVPGGAGNAHIAFSRGFFFVTKIISNQIVKVALDGEVIPLAGTGQPGHDDGAALEATLFRPNGIAVAPQGGTLYVNTMRGEYNRPAPSTLTVRVVDLVSLSEVLEAALAEGGLERLRERYATYKSDPVRAAENTVAEVITYAYRLLSGGQAAAAIAVFGLNVDSYPDDENAAFHLGEAFRYAGQIERAVEQYHRVLELDPDHAQAKARLSQLEG